MIARIALVMAMFCFAADAAAQAPSSEDKAAADAVFDQAKQLLATGEVAKACTMLEASLKLADQLGTRLNLADCYERMGRTASAWAEFREAASLAHKRGDRREQFAREHADALEARLVKLVVSVPAANRVPGLTVTRDGVAISAEVWDTPVPIDPGQHVITASADGYKPSSQTVDVGTEGVAKIEIPALVAAPKPLVRSQPEVDPIAEARHARKLRRTTGIVVGAAGAIAVGTSLVLGLDARSKWRDAQPFCNGDVCDGMGAQLNRDARSLGNTATVVFGVGAAAVITGVVLYVRAPKVPTEQPAVGVWTRSDGFGVTLTGQF